MASEQDIQTTEQTSNESVLTILSMLGGLGITTMVVAAGIGVVWENADSGLIGLFVMAGFGLLVAGVGGWVIVERPYEDFDDINQPNYHGHHHDDEHHNEDEVENVPDEHLDEAGEVNVYKPQQAH
ncbi:MAG: hypothetical protein AAF846_06380 [Chloroflexota bacterium]